MAISITRLTAIAAMLALAGCSGGEPGPNDMRSAFANSAPFMQSLAMSLQLEGQTLGQSSADPRQVVAGMTIEKRPCAAATGAAGYICELRIGRMCNAEDFEEGPVDENGNPADPYEALRRPSCTSGELVFADWQQARFFQSGGQWQFERLQ